MPRYVILYHEMPTISDRASHWDLMLEQAGALATWALDEPPQPGHVVAAQRLADHRLAYLDYEGPVSGDRGSVTRWDHGQYRLVSQSDKEWVVELSGTRLANCTAIVRHDHENVWSARFVEGPAGVHNDATTRSPRCD